MRARTLGSVALRRRLDLITACHWIEIAMALNLETCFTPLRSPESNGMAEALVKTFKRDYAKVNPIPDAAGALPWSPCARTIAAKLYRSPREYISDPVLNSPRVRSNGVNFSR